MKKCLALLFLCLSSVHAEQDLALQGAITAPISKVNFTDPTESESLGGPGPGGGAQYLYLPDSNTRWGAGVDVLYHGFGSSSDSELIPGADSKFSFQTVSVLAIGRLNFPTPSEFTPYLFVGLGISQNHLSWDITDSGTGQTIKLVDGSSTGFASAIGIGVDHPLSDNVYLGMEFRFMNTGHTSFGPTASGQALGVGDLTGSTGIVSGLIRIGYRFGPAAAPVKESPLQKAMGSSELPPPVHVMSVSQPAVASPSQVVPIQVPPSNVESGNNAAPGDTGKSPIDDR